MSRVEIIIPCYKYGHFLRECVESVLTQEGVDVCVLILDDASPDDTQEVGEDLARYDARVEYRRHGVNLGHIASYNEGLEWASRDYTVLLSADDVLLPGALLRAVRFMETHPELGMLYGRCVRFESVDQLQPEKNNGDDCPYRIWAGREWLEAVCRAGVNHIASGEVLVRTELQHTIGGYTKELPHTGDMEMWMRFAMRAPIGFIDAAQAGYRIHGRNMHFTIAARPLQEVQHCRATFDVFFRDYAHLLSDADRLRRLALAAVSRQALEEAYRAFHSRDMESCRRLVEIGGSFPEARQWRLYSRLVWMIRFGPSIWSVFRRLTFRKPICVKS